MNNGLFKNKYRIVSARLKNRDYAQNGFYFVTICTKLKHPYFGKIVDDEMVLNDIGRIVIGEWQKTEKIRKNVFLDEYIVMPNHLHGIIVIDNNIGNDDGMFVETHCNASLRGAFLQNEYKNKFGPQINNLSSIIRGFKGACTKQINKIKPIENFIWQTRFHDHIIRNEKSLNRIRQYIIDNPNKWERDRNNVINHENTKY